MEGAEAMMAEQHEPVGAMTSFHQVLIILFGALFFAPGGHEPIVDRVESAVSDGARKEKAVAAAKAIDAAVGEDVDAVIAWHEEFYRAIGEAGADEAAVRGKIDEIINRLAELEQEQLELRGDLRDQLEPEEWSEVFD